MNLLEGTDLCRTMGIPMASSTTNLTAAKGQPQSLHRDQMGNDSLYTGMQF